MNKMENETMLSQSTMDQKPEIHTCSCLSSLTRITSTCANLTENAAVMAVVVSSQDVNFLAVGFRASLVKVRVLGDLLGVVAAVPVVALAAAKLLLRRNRLQIVVQLRDGVGKAGGVPRTAQPRHRISDARHTG